MYRHILVPIDGSDQSRHVATHAYDLAAQLRARVTILHVLEDLGVPYVQYGMEPYVDLESVSPEVIEAQHANAQQLVDDAVAQAPEGVEASGRVIEAAGRRIAEIVAEIASGSDVDLVVMGTHGHRGLSRIFLGSVADGVIRAADVPVTLVRYHEHDGPDDHHTP